MQNEVSRPYIIFRRYQGAGFWSNFFCVIHSLDYADEHGLVPVVDMERYPTHYNEDDEAAAGALGTRNSWEYYFEQPGGLSLADALKASPLDNDGTTESRINCTIATPNELTGMRRVRELIHKYIRIRPEVLRQADAILPPGLNSRVLGVHVRGTDQRQGRFAAHPVPMPMICYLETAQQVDREHGFEHIYLACDEVETVTAFREVFGSRLVTSPVHRSSAMVDTAVDYQWLFGHQRPLHRYHLGMEVLLDALLLARCGHLMCGISNVTIGVRALTQENQVRHLIPPLWFTAITASPSRGLECLARFNDIGRSYSETATRLVQEELRRLLAQSEDATATLEKQASALQVNLGELHQITAELQRSNAELHQSNAQLQRSNAVLRKKMDRQRVQLEKAHGIIERLQSRVLKLVTRWTRLGWFFQPKSRPDWRKDPLRGCRVKSLDPGEKQTAANSGSGSA